MGCCSSSEAAGTGTSAGKNTPNAATGGGTTGGNQASASGTSGNAATPASGSTTTPSAGANTTAAPAKGPPAPQAAPAPGVKKVRAAYKGKGWAPPQKESYSSKKEKGDKVKTEIEDEWDDDGNLKRTITKKTTTPDWKFKTEKTVEMYTAEEAKKAGLTRGPSHS